MNRTTKSPSLKLKQTRQKKIVAKKQIKKQTKRSLVTQISRKSSPIAPITALSTFSFSPLTTTKRSYHPNVIEHYEAPRNVGSLDPKSDEVGTGLVGAPACGDVMKLQVKIKDGIVEDVKFRTFGCGSAIASSSYATTWLKGKTVDEALSIKNTDIASHLSLPPVKMHCSMLAEDAVKAAIHDYQKKQQLTASAAAL